LFSESEVFAESSPFGGRVALHASLSDVKTTWDIDDIMVQATTKSEITVAHATIGYDEPADEGADEAADADYSDDDFEPVQEEAETQKTDEVPTEQEAQEPEEDEYDDAEFDDDFEPETTEPEPASSVEQQEKAARSIQRIARGRQGRRKALDKRATKLASPVKSELHWNDADKQAAQRDAAQREAAACKIQAISRGRQGRAKAKAKKNRSSGVTRTDLGSGGSAGVSCYRQNISNDNV